jgi:hypothetical protein
MRNHTVAAALVAAFLSLPLLSGPAGAQLLCGPRAAVEADIAAQALQVVAHGEDINGTYFWWFANAATGLWAIFARPVGAPDQLCLMTVGYRPAMEVDRRHKAE